MRFKVRLVQTLFILLLVSLVSCEPIPPAPNPNNLSTPTPALTTAVPEGISSAEENISTLGTISGVQKQMLYSHFYWKTVWADALITSSSSDGSTSTQRVQVWIDQARARFRVAAGPQGYQPTNLEVSDGDTIQNYDFTSGKMESWPVNPISQEPFSPPETGTDTVYPHPLGQQLLTPMADLMFPTALAQRDGVYSETGREPIAGREAIIVEFNRPGQEPVDRMWVDAQTGVILKRQAYDKSGSGSLQTQYTVQSIEFDPYLPVEAFTLNIKQQPVFSDNALIITYAGEWIPQPAASPQTSTYGEVFFVTNNYGELNLMRFSADCLVQESACAAAEPVSGYPNQDSTINPLIWSNDGKRAALVVNDRLYIYTPQEDAWLLLARADSFSQPVWSPDGEWLAYSANDSGIPSLYAARPDGSELRSLSQSQASPENASLVNLQMEIQGWRNPATLLVSRFSPGERGYFTVDLNSGSWASLDMPVTGAKDYYVFSPDGQTAAYASYIDNGTRLTLVNGDGSTVREIITLANASIWPVVWSPDGKTLAFNASFGGDAVSAQVFAYPVSGAQGLKLVYSGGAVYSIHWSPTNNSLLLETDQEGRTQLVHAVIETGAYRPVILDGITAAEMISGVSWKPPEK